MQISKVVASVLLGFSVGILAQQQQQQDICAGFRITSPTMERLRWTSGQCYQVSYDLASALPFLKDGNNANISVDVYNAETNLKVSSVVVRESANTFGGTKAFNLQVPVSGAYYYMVTLTIQGDNDVHCGPKRTVTFEVDVNPNSPPAQC
ncbi:hypothetical protein [Parasitella parasitica]|uniref:Uncharacterized protein n=1 Tax=Parasitella parasitica TaxID=35722 RepID=A0A0B7MW79_9FUNG|nr:hypothetical protein [Parasitella parasitica]